MAREIKFRAKTLNYTPTDPKPSECRHCYDNHCALAYGYDNDCSYIPKSDCPDFAPKESAIPNSTENLK